MPACSMPHTKARMSDRVFSSSSMNHTGTWIGSVAVWGLLLASGTWKRLCLGRFPAERTRLCFGGWQRLHGAPRPGWHAVRGLRRQGGRGRRTAPGAPAEKATHGANAATTHGANAATTHGANGRAAAGAQEVTIGIGQCHGHA